MFRIDKKKFLFIIGIVVLILTATGCFSQEADMGGQSGVVDKRQAQDQEPADVNTGQEVPPSTTTTEAPLYVDIISMTSPVSPGGDPVTLFVKTEPGAMCEIDPGYKGGKNEADALLKKQANANGLLSWTWIVDPSVALGSYQVVVTAQALDGETASSREQIDIKTAEECKA